MSENQHEPPTTAGPTAEPPVEASAESVGEPSVEASADPVAESPVEASAESVGEPSVEASAEPVAEQPVGPSAESPAEPHVVKLRRRRRIAAVGAGVLLGVAVVAGVGYTVVTVDGADRDPGAAVWQFPKQRTDQAEKAPAKGLSGLLVAYTASWERGPDFGEFAADAQLSGAQATALRKESLRDLPHGERRQLEKMIDKEHVTGMAMRSYAKETGSSFFTDTAVTVKVTLSRMESPAVVRRLSTSQNALLGSLHALRDGPKIKGHKNARCFLPPKGADKHLDSMYCSAYQGDVLVTVSADGVKPFDSKGVAELVADQLDRIGDPGEAV